ncbi:MAG: sialidase family protein [Thermoplasmatales archaeon]|nr:sialidase family protein [Thermoplasmatales archaeon]
MRELKKSLVILTLCILTLSLNSSFASFGSEDGGSTIWSENIKLSYECVNPIYGKSIAVDGSNIYVVWADERYENPDYEYGSDFEIFFKKSTDGGKTWSDDIRLTNNSDQHTAEYWCNDMYPELAVNGNNIHVVWVRDIGSVNSHDEEIFYKKSTDGGGHGVMIHKSHIIHTIQQVTQTTFQQTLI